jgi:hypothetical protein
VQFILTQRKEYFNTIGNNFGDFSHFCFVEQKRLSWFVHFYIAQIVEKKKAL